MTDDEMIELMARAYATYYKALHEEAARIEDYENYEWAKLLALMAAVLTALRSAGMAVVPREPDDGMIEAGFEVINDGREWGKRVSPCEVYRAMIVARGE